MKPISNIFKKLEQFAAAAVLLLFVFGGLATAQQDYSSANDSNIVRDQFFAPADYQRPEPAPAEPFMEAIEQAEKMADQQAEQAPAWLSNIQSQASNLDLPRVFGSLAIVLAGYFVFVWLSRQMTGSFGDGGLPREVVEVLGQTPFGTKKNLQLVRLGSKLLLLINSTDGTQAIGEITDPHEVEYLIGLCGGKRTSRSALAIRKAADSIPNAGPANDLKRILTQLQQPTGTQKTNAVFEA